MSRQTPTYNFGEYPLHITLSTDGANYELDPEEVNLGEPAGVSETFPVNRLAIMKARAYAHGYDLQVEQVPATVLVPAATQTQKVW